MCNKKPVNSVNSLTSKSVLTNIAKIKIDVFVKCKKEAKNLLFYC